MKEKLKTHVNYYEQSNSEQKGYFTELQDHFKELINQDNQCKTDIYSRCI